MTKTIDRCARLLLVLVTSCSLQRASLAAAAKTSVFVEGDLGRVEWPSTNPGLVEDATAFQAALKQAATVTFKGILKQHLGASGDEDVRGDSEPMVDGEGHYHIRMRQYVQGLPVQGASMVVHVRGSGDGTVYAVNGDFSPSGRIVQAPQKTSLTCMEAMQRALAQSDIQGGTWASPCQEAAVRGDDGVIYLGFERTVAYGGYKKTTLFASGATGDLVAVHPLVHNSRLLDTRDCNETSTCTTVSLSSNPIHTSNYGVNGAHNNAIIFYNFFKSHYGRDSLDDEGIRLVSNVDILSSSCPDNAFWNGELKQMFYCPESSTQYAQASDPDTVFHELMHGVTQFTAHLIYQDESGAMNEGFSDIFAAVIARLMLGKTVEFTWKLFEDCYKDGVSILRLMTDPAAYGQTDYYPDRYQGAFDGGGVHINSGIANLAFVLITQGGKHPRQKSNFVVEPIDSNDFSRSIRIAARIFYDSLTMCMTESSGFSDTRRCNLLFAANKYKSTVADAWAAVGVGRRAVTTPSPTPVPPKGKGGKKGMKGRNTKAAMRGLKGRRTV